MWIFPKSTNTESRSVNVLTYYGCAINCGRPIVLEKMNGEVVEILKKQFWVKVRDSGFFTPDEIFEIQRVMLFEVFEQGQVLLKDGQLSSLSYFLIKGCFKSYFIMDGEEVVSNFYTETDIFSPAFIMSGKSSKEYLVCLEDCLVSTLTSDAEEFILTTFPRLERIRRIYSENLLAETKAEFNDFKMASPEQRYINFAAKRPDLLQRVPQYQIASYLGLTPQSLSRMRKRLLNDEIAQRKVAV